MTLLGHRTSAKWYDIGIELKFKVGTLKRIKMQYRDDPPPCLCEMLIEWLKSVIPEPSWKTLLTALCAKAVGERDLARQSKTAY